MRLSFAVGVVTALFAATVAAQQQRDSTAHRGRQLPTVEVIGAPAALVGIPGSGTLLSAGLLKAINPRDAGQALRVVPGLLVRDEEGLGLRPNIGIRGLNPTRSAKVLLLEDGIPFTIAPYGDNATYYHPPVERFDRIEVLKGSGQIRYGPQTIGGVINYLTPALSREWKGLITTTIGNREYLNLAGRARGGLEPQRWPFTDCGKAGRVPATTLGRGSPTLAPRSRSPSVPINRSPGVPTTTRSDPR